MPDGHELWPRLRPQLVRELLSLEGDDRAVFLGPGQDPLHIAECRQHFKVAACTNANFQNFSIHRQF